MANLHELPPDAFFEIGANDGVELDKPHEECGVVGIWLSEPLDNIAEVIREGLTTLQHRGEEAAGVAVASGEYTIHATKDPGRIAQALGGSKLSGLPGGRQANGHVRYGTVMVHKSANGDKSIGNFEAAGPAIADSSPGMIALGHNGNVLRVREICNKFGVNAEEYVTDSAGLTAAVAAVRPSCNSLSEALVTVFSEVKEAFSLTVIGEGQLIGMRDPHGFRPLMLGTYPENGGYALASESHTLAAMGASYRREIARGEMVVCNTDGSLTSSFPFPEKPSKLCAMEFIYFSAPHGELMGRSVHMVRKKLGEILAQEHPVDADAVIGVPDSGMTGAEGYADASGIPRVSGLVKNRYTGRTFIIPGQETRVRAVRQKLQAVVPEVYKKRLIIVDDSIVRGTTSKAFVAMLWEAGATEVHLRITSPPNRWPCYYGMDTANPEELIANQIPSVKKLGKYLGVTSLEYLSIEGLRAAAADAAGSLCMACMDGEYPTEIPLHR